MTEVLIVEDEADILDILSFNLENAGYKVLAASSAEEGIKLLGPDTALILLDVMLPGMSGFQMARQLRKENRSHVPIIFLTARGTENDILTGFSAGGDDYIPVVRDSRARRKAAVALAQGIRPPGLAREASRHIFLARGTHLQPLERRPVCARQDGGRAYRENPRQVGQVPRSDKEQDGLRVLRGFPLCRTGIGSCSMSRRSSRSSR